MDNQAPPVADDDADVDASERGLGRVSIRDMRKYGMTWGGRINIPGIPSQDLTPDEATLRIKDREALLGVLSVGWGTVNSPPPDAEPEAARALTPPKPKRRRPSRAKAKPTPVAAPEPRSTPAPLHAEATPPQEET